MQAIRERRHFGTVRWGRARALALAATLALLALPAQALQYFDGPSGLGFDNSSLMLTPDIVIPTSETDPSFPFEFIAGGVTTGVPVGLDVAEVINESPIGTANIDRTITFTILNNDALTDLMIVLTFLGASDTDYSAATFDLDVDGFDQMQIASWGPLVTFAGFALGIDDFTDVGGTLTATRTFRYTVSVPQGSDAPALSVALTRTFSVPEPATGLLLAGALLVAAGAGRKRAA